MLELYQLLMATGFSLMFALALGVAVRPQPGRGR